MNYVKMYKQAFNIDFDGKKYEIHHLDLDHSNNALSNLLLLPTALHRKYHMARAGYDGYPAIVTIQGSMHGYSYIDEHLKALKKLADVLEECRMWADYKSFLMGQYPNIHNITLEKKP